MRFDFAALKSQVRQTVHDTLAVPALYHSVDLDVPVELTVRWHTKIDRFGDLDGMGYAEVIDGINRVIFNRPELQEHGLVLRGGGEVELTSSGFEGVRLVLVSMEPDSGPVDESWVVAQR